MQCASFKDLKFVHEEMGKSWALDLKLTLLQANVSKKNGDITPELYRKTQSEIETIVSSAIILEQTEEKQPDKGAGKRKRQGFMYLACFQRPAERSAEISFKP